MTWNFRLPAANEREQAHRHLRRESTPVAIFTEGSTAPPWCMIFRLSSVKTRAARRMRCATGLEIMRPKSPAPRSPLVKTWRLLASIIAAAATGLHSAGA
jgi:hypothetical protein